MMTASTSASIAASSSTAELGSCACAFGMSLSSWDSLSLNSVERVLGSLLTKTLCVARGCRLSCTLLGDSATSPNFPIETTSTGLSHSSMLQVVGRGTRCSGECPPSVRFFRPGTASWNCFFLTTKYPAEDARQLCSWHGRRVQNYAIYNCTWASHTHTRT